MQVCEKIRDTFGVGAEDGRKFYNTVACGNGPFNDAGDEDYNAWMLSVAEAHVTLRQENAPLQEALHHDGAASLLHLGLTFFGRRTVTFLQEPVAESVARELTPTIAADVVMPCEPGHIYLGG